MRYSRIRYVSYTIFPYQIWYMIRIFGKQNLGLESTQMVRFWSWKLIRCKAREGGCNQTLNTLSRVHTRTQIRDQIRILRILTKSDRILVTRTRIWSNLDPESWYRGPPMSELSIEHLNTVSRTVLLRYVRRVQNMSPVSWPAPRGAGRTVEFWVVVTYRVN